MSENRVKSSDESIPNSDDRSGERKTWIRFEEQPQNNDSIHVSIDESHSIATINPSNSIQIINPSENANIPDSNKRSSTSPVSNTLPQTIQRIKSNTLSNNGSNKSINTNNNENRQSIGETSTHSSLQNIPLKDTNNSTQQQNQCNHSSSPNSVYTNGDVIVTLLPLNTSCSWLTPATFKPELVPEELMAQSLSLTVEDYVSAMQVLINDLRFNLYITLYKRILVLWIALGFVVLLALLFSGVKGLALFGGGVLWLIINALGIFATMWIKIKKFLKDMLENENQMPNSEQPTTRSNLPAINPSRMDIDTTDIVITGSTPKSLSQKEKYAEKLLLRYSQRWVKDFVRRRIDLNLPLHADSAGVSVTPLPSNPRHCISSRCLCQFIEEHLRFKPLTQCNITELFM